MSGESEEVFTRAWRDYLRDYDAEPLQAAAVQHLDCSRSVAELTALYAQALEAGDHATAQAVAEELVPVRAADRIASGHLPGTGA